MELSAPDKSVFTRTTCTYSTDYTCFIGSLSVHKLCTVFSENDSLLKWFTILTRHLNIIINTIRSKCIAKFRYTTTTRGMCCTNDLTRYDRDRCLGSRIRKHTFVCSLCVHKNKALFTAPVTFIAVNGILPTSIYVYIRTGGVKLLFLTRSFMRPQ